MREARHSETLGDGSVRCVLCRHRCVIREGKTGICRVRKNVGGILFALTYERCVARHLDPIEKKPLFHVLPGTSSYSIATAGCNFRCAHCQNYEISQISPDEAEMPGTYYSHTRVVDDACASGARSISYTYTEPTVFYEYAYDTAVEANKRGLRNIFVTNGYTEATPLAEIKSVLDAANVDLKAFSENFYRTICGAKLTGVLDCLKLYKKLGIWIEVTTLVIPGHNDSTDELRDIARFIANELDRDTPWHVSAFYPTYKLTDAPRTPPATLRKARETGLQEGLRYVYTGNISGDEGESTYCPGCGSLVIKRRGFSVLKNRMNGNTCGACGCVIAGIWS